VGAAEFKPKAKSTPYGEVKNVGGGVGFVNMQSDDGSGIVFYKQSESCECCKGFVNMCQGDICEALGVCYCVVH